MKTRKAILIHVKGLVQGIGFRPFIYRLAIDYNIKGWVENRNDGVRIHGEGTPEKLESFLNDISSSAPQASSIRTVTSQDMKLKNHEAFIIKKSEDASGDITDISPDIAVCDKCLDDMNSQLHRIAYPFINCTNCGPRFTIISDLPYDRDKTTMQVFPMCAKCREEYTDILDRRFHAQPVACNDCGPQYTMYSNGEVLEKIKDILSRANREIMSGKILAIKGLGGFHLACNAFDEEAVRTLRNRKTREGKPFAVMFRNQEVLKEYFTVSETESSVLLSWRRPILILKNRSRSPQLARSVSNGFNTTGVMLPYMPFHHLLFEILETPAIVLTSGNISDEPILIDNEKAMSELHDVADSFIVYNRHILNRTDDSVAMVVNNKLRLIRRSRGFVPSPIETSFITEGIFASGAELVNCFCIGKGNQALLSQHIGDLKNLETLEFYEESLERYQKMFRFEPEIFAVDMHPDYLSHKFCLEYSASHTATPGMVITEVQHHHAHIASCMAEHGLDEEVIGVSLDGVGYGTDGHIWGFEFMVCDLADFERYMHPEYIPQPGGDLTTHEPWRMAVSYLYKAYGNEMRELHLPFLKEIEAERLDLVMDTIDKKINTPMTCSAGRLFDAVSAMTGTCLFSDFHAEAPMRLEQIVDESDGGSYPIHLNGMIEVDPIIRGIVNDIQSGVPAGSVSAKFHHTIAQIIIKVCLRINEERGLRTVILSGGTFQNRYLLSSVETMLKDRGMNVYSQENVPANDAGIALGQLIVAAKRKTLGLI